MLRLLLGLWLALVTSPQETGTIQGTVRRGDTSDPIGGVQISLLAPQLLERIRTVSDAQGRFSFESVPFGRYTIQVAREGHFTYPAGQPLPYPVTSVQVGPQRNHLFIDLMPGGVIGGRVTDAQGRPLPGVRVSAMELQYRNGNPAFSVGSVPERTDQRGAFRMSWFAPGEYYVRAEVVAAQNDLARKSYYPGTLDPNIAVPLVLRSGESIENLHFVVPEAPATTISGVVIADGPITGVVRTFYLLPLDGRPSEVYPLEFTNLADEPPQGQSVSFKLDVRGVAPGFYDLAPFYMDRENVYHSGRTRIEIGSQNTENLTAVITPNADVFGRLIIEDNNASQGFNGVQFHLRPKDAAVPLMTRTSTAAVAADGTFVIKDVFEGRYQLHMTVSPRALSDLYIAAIRQGAQDLRNDGIIDVRL
ncbi:MAG TPA: carboxypeptidase-like regulatory domain-containing protein, partial [Terriglobia bacterium]|nr:carboxypeptidase-like regulatory domain-containing protein [Terriglobia bacterium]